MPTPVSTAPAVPRASLRRTALHHIHSSSTPRTTRVPSVAISKNRPAHDGASATPSITERYADTDAPSVTSTAPASPSPPGASQTTTPAPAPNTLNTDNQRPARTFFRNLRSMKSNLGAGATQHPGRTTAPNPHDGQG